MTVTQPRPIELRLRKSAGVLNVAFDSGEKFELPFEYLRVFSPSAEVRGHGTEILQTGKEHVKVIGVEPVGQLRRVSQVRRRPRHRPVLLAGALRSGQEPAGELVALSQAPRGRGLPTQADLNQSPITGRLLECGSRSTSSRHDRQPQTHHPLRLPGSPCRRVNPARGPGVQFGRRTAMT